MTYQTLLTFLGSLLIVFGLVEGGWLFVFVWLGCDFLVLGLAHGRGWHNVFGKRSDGTLPWWSLLLFFPMLIYTAAVWRLGRWISREPAQNVVNDWLVVGRRLLSSEVEGEFVNYVDLTAEFIEPPAIRRLPCYRSFPILDGGAPAPEALRTAVASLRPGRTFIHCAQGHGRTGLFALALLLSSGAARNVQEGLRLLSAARPRIRLSRAQRKCIELYALKVGPVNAAPGSEKLKR